MPVLYTLPLVVCGRKGKDLKPMEDKYAGLKLGNQLCFPLYASAKEVVRQYKPFLDRVGLTYTQYITMMILWEAHDSDPSGSMNVKALGERLFLDSGTLTPLLKKLETKGYLKRERSTEDERCVYIVLTESGQQLREQAKPL